MARTKQRLINYHTSDKTAMPTGSDVHYGEIVVRHNAESPELLIKVGDDSFGVFQASGAVKTAIDKAVSDAQSTLNTDISNLESKVDKFSGATVAEFTSLKQYTDDTFATKIALQTAQNDITTAYTKAVGDAKVEVYDSATTFATNVKNELNGTISTVKNNLEALSGVVESISTNIGDNYVTTDKLNTTVETLESKISTAKDNAISSGKTYTDAQITAAKEYSDGKLSAATESLKSTITVVDNKVTALSGNVHTTITNVQTALTKTINDKVATAYRYKGSCTYAELPASGSVIGEVWNVTDANGNFPAGTNYAWDGSNWDALGGSIDLSPYAKTEDVNKKIETINQTNADLQSAIGNVSAATETLVGKVSAATVATYATKTALQTAQDNITTAYTKAIGDAKAEAIGTASGYTDAQVLAAKNALGQTIQAVDGRVTDLSGVTKTVKATADSAVQTASVDCGVSVKKEGTELKFSFAELIIDCGDF